MNTKALFTLLKKINEPLTESYIPTTSNRIIQNFKNSLDNRQLIVPASALMQKYVSEQHDEETAFALFERLVEYGIVPEAIIKHDLSTYEGYMDAVEEVMSEMVSGAAIGGRFSGIGTNAQVNATGMAAPTGPDKKKKPIRRIENILNKRL